MLDIKYDVLLSEVEKQNTRINPVNQSVSVVEQKNLKYAMNCIKPVKHQEFAFIVWCGHRPEPVTNWIDEYARRRAGEPSQLLDHPILDLTSWCVPESYRILVYREQFQALIKELTDVRDNARASEILTEMYRMPQRADADRFLQNIFSIKWKEALSITESEFIACYIQDYYPRSLPYAYCSTIVERSTK